jgi:hypothetical protein
LRDHVQRARFFARWDQSAYLIDADAPEQIDLVR